jgi:hypothetical protein
MASISPAFFIQTGKGNPLDSGHIPEHRHLRNSDGLSYSSLEMMTSISDTA